MRTSYVPHKEDGKQIQATSVKEDKVDSDDVCEVRSVSQSLRIRKREVGDGL